MSIPLLGAVLRRPMALQAVVVLIAGAFVIGALSGVTGRMSRLSSKADTNSEAAEIALKLSHEIDAGGSWFRYEGALLAELGDRAAVQPQVPPDLIADATRSLDGMVASAAELHRLVGSASTLQILGLMEDGRSSTLSFFLTLSPEDANELQLSIDAAQVIIDEEAEVRTAVAAQQRAQIVRWWSIVWVALVVATVISSTTVLTTTWALHRRQRRALDWAVAEHARATAISEAVQRRNEQFYALYHIMTEVTDSISLRHVIDTTIAQVRKIVPADSVGLRLLRDGELVLAGSWSAGPEFEPNTISLGSGCVGIAARRGRIIRMEQGADEAISDGERIPGIESCLVLPLVMGARVVGTLACWSALRGRFSADDEHFLEMMAPQVANAIVAAEAFEANDMRARTDALTGLPNRGQLERDIEGHFAMLPPGDRYAVAMVDADHFKAYNDTFGHAAGDAGLRTLGRTLAAAVRAEDRIYRYGGEEFLVVFANVDGETGARLAERIREKVELAPIAGPGGQPLASLTVSIGVAAHPGDGDAIEAVIEAADRALYRSKNGGRNRVTLASDIGPESLAA